MTETRYDRATAGLCTTVVALVATTLVLAAIVIGRLHRSVRDSPVPIEVVNLADDASPIPGGLPELEVPSGVLGPAMMEFNEDYRNLDELAEVAVELSDRAAQQFEFRLSHEEFRAAQSWINGRGGVPAALRWYIKFDDSTLKEYAGQLDYFGIEPGAYFSANLPSGPRLVYLSNVSSDRPTVREIVKGTDHRLHMCWRGDRRGDLDQILFRIVDVDVSDAILLLFIPAETERYLATIEREYRHKPAHEIRRTYFRIEPFESGFRFVVVSQSYTR